MISILRGHAQKTLIPVVALVLVQRIGSTYRDGLEVTRDGAEILTR